MITKISGLPENMVGFRATGNVSANDFNQTVIPQVAHLLEKQNKLNYMLVLDTDLADFTAGAWLADAWLGLKEFTQWNRTAIISDSKTLGTVTDIFSKMMIGEFRVFEHVAYDEAVLWVSGTKQ